MFVAGHHADLFISGRSILHVGDCWEEMGYAVVLRETCMDAIVVDSIKVIDLKVEFRKLPKVIQFGKLFLLSEKITLVSIKVSVY